MLLAMRQWKTLNYKKRKQGSPSDCHNSLPREKVTGHYSGRWNPGSLWKSTQHEGAVGRSGKPNTAKVSKEEYRRGENAKTTPEIFNNSPYSVEYKLAHYVGKLPKSRKEPPEKIGRNNAWDILQGQKQDCFQQPERFSVLSHLRISVS